MFKQGENIRNFFCLTKNYKTSKKSKIREKFGIRSIVDFDVFFQILHNTEDLGLIRSEELPVCTEVRLIMSYLGATGTVKSALFEKLRFFRVPGPGHINKPVNILL